MVNKVVKSPEQWREQLDAAAFMVCRERGTERPFTGAYHDCKADGSYHCACCGALLFDARQKYDSGSGWPSYWAPAAPENVEEREDGSHGMRRTEVVCAACDAHLGHLFPDGPAPTGLRYCINSASLDLRERGRGEGDPENR